MPVDLIGVDTKLKRAQHHLNAINTSARYFVKRKLFKPPADFIPPKLDLLNEDWQVIRWYGVTPSPLIWGAMLGDFAHDVRSALDQLIWALVLANNGTADNDTQFPVAESDAKWRDLTDPNRADRLSPIHGISDKAFALIRDVQPFRTHPGRGRAVKAPLYKLLIVSNEDKHRTLHGSALYANSKALNLRFEPRGYIAIVGKRFPQRGLIVENGAEIARVKLRLNVPFPPPVGIQVKVAFDQPSHVGFFVGERHIINLGELKPILSDARRVLTRARLLPEISAHDR
jgi:hypothetical protein